MEKSISSQTARAMASATKGVVLLVEDEAEVREITARVLESGGYQVLQASGAGNALRLAATHPGSIDLLLTDVVMPETNGIALGEQICELRPNVVTVYMSGYPKAEVLRKPTARSAMHIQKPFTVKSLLSRIAEALAAAAVGKDTEVAIRLAAPQPSEAMRVAAVRQAPSRPAVE